MLNKADAEAIARKLQAHPAKGKGAHLVHRVYVDGKWVATVSIRHGSSRDAGHDHVIREIFETPHDAKELAICRRKYEHWLESMHAKGKIAAA
jgi:hypothetical protein